MFIKIIEKMLITCVDFEKILHNYKKKDVYIGNQYTGRLSENIYINVMMCCSFKRKKRKGLDRIPPNKAYSLRKLLKRQQRR